MKDLNKTMQKNTSTGMVLFSLEFGLSTLTCVLPTDEPDEVMDAGVGDGHHCHGM